jgi:histone-lysine N-methyltransferase SETD3
MKFGSQVVSALCLATGLVHGFVPVSNLARKAFLRMAGGEGGDTEWAKALQESTGPVPGEFEKEMKLKGLLSGQNNKGDSKLTANANLIRWLEEGGDVYLSESSSWGDAPHPMAISTETVDEITNESSGRGLLARRDISDGDELLMIPIKLCITKKSARKALGKDAIPSEINEYLAMACQLIHERFVKGEQSFWKPYMDVLPEVGEVNPTFTWGDEDLSFLEGSPITAATRSLQMKLRREYDALLGGEAGLIARFPDRFSKEVSAVFLWALYQSMRCTSRIHDSPYFIQPF